MVNSLAGYVKNKLDCTCEISFLSERKHFSRNSGSLNEFCYQLENVFIIGARVCTNPPGGVYCKINFFMLTVYIKWYCS